jgi:hypothetical protein
MGRVRDTRKILVGNPKGGKHCKHALADVGTILKRILNSSLWGNRMDLSFPGQLVFFFSKQNDEPYVGVEWKI